MELVERGFRLGRRARKNARASWSSVDSFTLEEIRKKSGPVPPGRAKLRTESNLFMFIPLAQRDRHAPAPKRHIPALRLCPTP